MVRPYIIVINHDREELGVTPVDSVPLAFLAIAEHRRGGRKIEGILTECSSPKSARKQAKAIHPEYHFLASIDNVTKRMESDPLPR